MSFKCQRDSYLSRCSSRVVSCCPAVDEGGRQIHEVVLEDTVLFPGGGGQVGRGEGGRWARGRVGMCVQYTRNPFFLQQPDDRGKVSMLSLSLFLLTHLSFLLHS